MPRTLDEYPSGGTKIPIDMKLPPGGGTHPAVLVLHGTFGLERPFGPAIEAFGDTLVAKGIGAAIPRYFHSTGTSGGPGVGPQDIATNLPAWRRTCADALAFVATHPAVDGAHLGLLGFSLGGHLVLDLGMTPPAGVALTHVVEFFGPTIGMEGRWANLPRLQIHHGEDDTDVPLLHSLHLVQKLTAAGKVEGRDFTLIKYPRETHVFTDPALAKARDATVGFFLT